MDERPNIQTTSAVMYIMYVTQAITKRKPERKRLEQGFNPLDMVQCPTS